MRFASSCLDYLMFFGMLAACFGFGSAIMRRLFIATPLILVLSACLLLLWHGPIAQLSNYHAFADQRTLFGVPHALDVFSNLGLCPARAVGLVANA